MFYAFSGNAGEEISVPYNVAHAMTGDMEIETVIRILRNNASGVIVAFSGYDNAGVETQSNNTLYSLVVSGYRLAVNHEYANGTNFGQSGPITLSSDWIRVRMVRSGLTYTIYVNGVVYLQATFGSNQVPAFTLGSPSAQLRVGLAYIEQMTALRLTYVNLAYVKVKNGSGTTVYELGDDPGGAPGVNPPFTTARFLDPFDRLFTRPIQTQVGRIDYDPFGFVAERKPQRGTGYILDMTGSGKGNGSGSEPIQTPRAYPLETSWKKANPSQFS